VATIQEMAGKQASAIQQILQLVHVSHLSPTRHTRLGSQSVTYHNDLFGAKTYTNWENVKKKKWEERILGIVSVPQHTLPQPGWITVTQ